MTDQNTEPSDGLREAILKGHNEDYYKLHPPGGWARVTGGNAAVIEKAVRNWLATQPPRVMEVTGEDLAQIAITDMPLGERAERLNAILREKAGERWRPTDMPGLVSWLKAGEPDPPRVVEMTPQELYKALRPGHSWERCADQDFWTGEAHRLTAALRKKENPSSSSTRKMHCRGCNNEWWVLSSVPGPECCPYCSGRSFTEDFSTPEASSDQSLGASMPDAKTDKHADSGSAPTSDGAGGGDSFMLFGLGEVFLFESTETLEKAGAILEDWLGHGKFQDRTWTEILKDPDEWGNEGRFFKADFEDGCIHVYRVTPAILFQAEQCN